MIRDPDLTTGNPLLFSPCRLRSRIEYGLAMARGMIRNSDASPDQLRGAIETLDRYGDSIDRMRIDLMAARLRRITRLTALDGGAA